jgi:hypothetical protein
VHRSILMLDRASVWGPPAALAAALPAATRLSREGFSFPDGLIGVAALLSVPVVLLIVSGGLLRQAFGDLETDNRLRVKVGLSIWAAICFSLDAALGTVLQSSTHHRALGGVTFAAMALGVAIASALVAWRIEAVTNGLVRRGTFWRGAVVGSGVAALAVLVAITAKAWSGLSQPARSCAIDSAIVLLAVGAGVWLPLRRRLWPFGLAGLVALIVIGALRVGSSDQLAAAIGARAPVAWAVGAAVGIMH